MLRLILACVFILAVTSSALASVANVYVGQTAAGAGDGTSCANQYAVTFFNTGANWGVGATQIGPGSVVHLCGTLTTGIEFQDSGTVGNLIKVVFETGAKYSQTTWVDGYSTAKIRSDGKSYLEIDGGVDGIIEATDNGNVGPYANQNAPIGMYFKNGTNIRVHHVKVRNLFIQCEGCSKDCLACGTALVIESCNSCRADHNTFHDMQLGIVPVLNDNMSDLEIDNNVLYHNSINIQPVTQETSSPNNILIHDNDFSDWSNWDDDEGYFHQNGIFAFTVLADAGTTTNFRIYNNYFHGDPSVANTAAIHIYWYYNNLTSLAIFNNVFNFDTNGWTNGVIVLIRPAGAPATFSGTIVANNTFNPGSGGNSTCVHVPYTGATGTIIKNNIAQCSQYYFSGEAVVPTASDYNNFYNITYYGVGASGNPTLAGWRTQFSLDANSVEGNPLVSAAGIIPVGSAAISAGTDLSGLGITALNSDKAGNARSGAWDIGAYNYSASPSTGSGKLIFLGGKR